MCTSSLFLSMGLIIFACYGFTSFITSTHEVGFGVMADEYLQSAPRYYPPLPDHPATEVSEMYGRYGGFPRLLTEREFLGAHKFTRGYRGFSYRGGLF